MNWKKATIIYPNYLKVWNKFKTALPDQTDEMIERVLEGCFERISMVDSNFDLLLSDDIIIGYETDNESKHIFVRDKDFPFGFGYKLDLA